MAFELEIPFDIAEKSPFPYGMVEVEVFEGAVHLHVMECGSSVGIRLNEAEARRIAEALLKYARKAEKANEELLP